MNTPEVVVLDLRDESTEQPVDPSGGVVVLDHANSLVKHAPFYLDLLSEDMVTSVVCVAVGEPDEDHRLDGVALTLPPVLRHAVVLWVGDARGVDWARDRSAPRPPDRPGSGLDDLVAALRVPELFDRLVEVAEGLAGAAVSPGIRLVSCAADEVELATARAAAVRSLCARDDVVGRDIGAAVVAAHLPPAGHGAVFAGPVHRSELDVLQRLNHVAELAHALSTPAALFGSGRPGEEIARHVLWAGQAVENYRLVLVELLTRIDSHVQVGRPSTEDVVAMGVSPPVEPAGAQIAADLRRAVDDQLDGGVALAALAHELRMTSARSGPQGCTAALEDARGRGPIGLAMPVFQRWPLSVWCLPLVLLACALVSFALGPGWAGWGGGALLAGAWFGAGWLTLARRPGPEGEFGLGAALPPALLTYGVVAVAGVVLGAVGAAYAAPLDVPGWLVHAVVWAAVLLSGAVVVLSWRSAVRRWRDRLALAAMREAVADLTLLAEHAVAKEWRPLRRRKAIAAAAAEVAAGLEEIVDTLRGAEERLFPVPRGGAGPDDVERVARPVPQELYAVVRADLVDVCRSALEPAWPAATSALRTSPGVYEQRLDRLLDEYADDVRRRGVFTATAFSRDDGPRDLLMARVWSETPAASAALRAEADGEMTQLCRSGQLGYLSTSAEPGLLRFAPARLRRVVRDDGADRGLAADPSVTWGHGGELVGAMRLLPLRMESVRHDVGGGE
ncbi:hypothetical protein [Saccharothrix sp. Mg75]|uniref:hypothetical protein n=1 Tax=Saccharothrix sp. Mg75 TaxID=3445357 RepID=UPI003EF02625